MRAREPERPRRPADEWPAYWFSQFEGALSAGDLARAATAHDRLRRMGIHVRIDWTEPPSPEAPGQGDANHE